MKEKLKVCCLIIIHDNKFLILKRDHKGPRNNLWEFPGGKIEFNESQVSCVKRELKEELNLKISNLDFFYKVHKEYDDIEIELISYITYFEELPNLELKVHSDYKWIRSSEFKDYVYPSANEEIISKIYLYDLIFPQILESVKIDYDSIYGYDLPLIHTSISKIEKYLKTHYFGFLIDAIELKPEIYFDDAIDVNEIFLKISPLNQNYTKNERLFIDKNLVAASTVVWTSYQNLIRFIQNNPTYENLEELKKMKLSIEKAVFSKTKKNISKKDFRRFMGRRI